MLHKGRYFIDSNIFFLPYWKDERTLWLSLVVKRYHADSRLYLASTAVPVSDLLQNKGSMPELIFCCF